MRFGFTAIVAALLAVAACAPKPPMALSETGGRAMVLGPEPGFEPAQAGDPWWRSPSRASNRFDPVDLKGTYVLRVNAPDADASSTGMLGRRLAVPLLSMPYLQWAWYLEPVIFDGGPGDGLDRGLRLSIGFYGGAPSSPQITDRLFGGSGDVPAFDRRIDLVFGGIGAGRNDNSTQRMSAVSDKGIEIALRPPQFNQAGEWKIEAIDLVKLYEQFWPRDRMNRTQIVFIAVAGLPGRPVVKPATPPLPLGYFAEVSLTR
jgi:hypothetical protein